MTTLEPVVSVAPRAWHLSARAGSVGLLAGLFVLVAPLLADPAIGAAAPAHDTAETRCQGMAARVSRQPQEQWIWREICAGRVADLDRFESSAPISAPCVARRAVSARFVASVLFEESLSLAIPRQGLRIRRGCFPEGLNVPYGVLKRPLWIEHSLVEGGVDLSNTHAQGLVAFHGSRVVGPFRATFAKLDGNLDLSGGDFESVSLAGAKIQGQLSATDARIRDELNIFSARIENSVWLDRSLVCGRLYAVSADITGHLSLGSTFLGDVDLEGARISGNLNLDAAQASQPASPSAAPELDCVAPVSSVLPSAPVVDPAAPDAPRAGRRLASGFPSWHCGVTVSLRGARIDALAAGSDPAHWARRIDVDGFTYAQFARLDGGGGLRDARGRELHEWLKRQGRPSRQPYEQAAKILREAGHSLSARELLYRGRRWEHSTAWWGRWLWDLPAWLLVGYGYREWYAGLWAIGLVVVGAEVFRRSREAHLARMPYGIAYSFDILLPLVKLRDRHYKIDLAGRQRYYFYFHRIMGYMLATFLAGALTGLIK